MERIDFAIQEAGCLIYVADRFLNGQPFEHFDEFLGRLEELTPIGAVMAMSLYQDDGYNVRVVCGGDLTEEERAEWTGKVSWKLNLSSGNMIVSGVCDEDLDDYLLDFPKAENDGDYHLGCMVEVPPGEYGVSVYSYPPNDLSGGWMRLEDPTDFRICFGKESGLEFEKPLNYFARTRPNEEPPAWIKDGYEDATFLDFLIHLTPLSNALKTPAFEEDGCILWEYRKPYVCPIGIRI